MERFWQGEAEQLVIWIAALMMMVAVAIYVVAKIRPKPLQNEHQANEWLSKYREMHVQGKLSDEEFRKIRTNLAPRVKDELKDSSDEA